MPIYNKWLDQSGEIASRDLIDRECCEQFGWAYSEKRFCMPFQVLETVALAILVKAQKADPNVTHVTPEMFDQYCIDNPDVHHDPVENAVWRSFFERYKFIAWYQRH